jgi:hypothetical protein
MEMIKSPVGMGRRRMIIDCERDQKGIHDYKEVAEGVVWCHSCGAIGYTEGVNWKKMGLSGVTTTDRVQE